TATPGQLLNRVVAEKCYNPQDPALTFVDADDDHDFECDGYTSKRAKMSCGHTVTPTSLTRWCQRQLNQGKSKLECGVCNTKWSLDEVFKMALLTDEEKTSFESILFKNFCPGCKSQIMRKDPNNLRVRCPRCTADRGAAFDFCWQCLKDWKGPAYHSNHCDNEGCVCDALVTLKTCKVIEFKQVDGVAGCPSIRACPRCGTLVEFCFVCLKLTKDCSGVTHSYFSACATGVAPRQTSIPVKETI
uniref:RING-type domain-containing protein n=1 Tax=Neogobius melanostomus TaxID=47308 RepID=A0A8C6SJW4_9GOBI